MKLNFVHGILVGFFLKENLNKLNFKKEKKEKKENKEEKEQKEQAEPTKAAYRVIAMTIATVEG